MIFTTLIRAIDPTDGELKTFGGPNIPAFSKEAAEQYLQYNGLGYCVICGILIQETTMETNPELYN